MCSGVLGSTASDLERITGRTEYPKVWFHDVEKIASSITLKSRSKESDAAKLKYSGEACGIFLDEEKLAPEIEVNFYPEGEPRELEPVETGKKEYRAGTQAAADGEGAYLYYTCKVPEDDRFPKSSFLVGAVLRVASHGDYPPSSDITDSYMNVLTGAARKVALEMECQNNADIPVPGDLEPLEP